MNPMNEEPSKEFDITIRCKTCGHEYPMTEWLKVDPCPACNPKEESE